MKRGLIEQILLYDYRYLIAYITLIASAAFTHFWRLGDLLPGLSKFESDYLATIDLSGLVLEPLYWPHKLLTWLVADNFGANGFWLRLVSVVFALGAVLMFFYLIRNRFRDRVAIIAVGLLITSSWWLHYARLARPEILIPFAIFSLMLLSKKAQETSHPGWLIGLILMVGLSLYIPAMPYAIAIGAFVTRSLIKQVWRGLKTPLKVTLITILAIMSGPLLVAIGRDLTLLRELLLLPADWTSPLVIGQAMISNLAEIFWYREAIWPLGLGTVPLLDIFTAVMVALGLYHLDHEISRSLTHFVLVGLGLMLLLISFDPSPTDSIILLPFIYILAASGVVMLLSQWYEIFPRNPIARLTAFLPTAVLIIFVIGYHQERYFIAWPQSPETVEAFYPLSEQVNQIGLSSQSSVRYLVLEEENSTVEASLLDSQAAFTVENQADPATINDQDTIVISAGLYDSLPSKTKSQLPDELSPVTTPFSTYPVAVWTNIADLN